MGWTQPHPGGSNFTAEEEGGEAAQGEGEAATRAGTGASASTNGSANPGTSEYDAAVAVFDNTDAPSAKDVTEPKVKPKHDIDSEITAVAVPTLATLAADPIAALVSTSFVGRLGATELAAVGVSLSVYNTVSKLLNVPLLSVTTSTIASALGEMEEHRSSRGERIGAAASSAILLALLIGGAQAVLLGLFGVAGLGAWGVGPASPLRASAVVYLGIRALAAPAGVLFITLQGVFRGLGDTKAPFYATIVMNALNIGLEYVLIWQLGWGVRGAAVAMAMAQARRGQALSAGLLLLVLRQRCSLGLVGGAAVREALRFLKPTGLLVLRTVATTATVATASSIAARTDPVWLASSLLADSLAVAAQALMARSLASEEWEAARHVAWRCLALSLCLGLVLLAGLALWRDQIAALFTHDPAVLVVMSGLMPLVFCTQPLNALAFVMDGILMGVSGFSYAARAMAAAAAPAILVMVVGSHAAGGSADLMLLSVWAGLALFMLSRLATLFVPLVRWQPPFDVLYQPHA
eukprot:scaffold8.g1482.t1